MFCFGFGVWSEPRDPERLPHGCHSVATRLPLDSHSIATGKNGDLYTCARLKFRGWKSVTFKRAQVYKSPFLPVAIEWQSSGNRCGNRVAIVWQPFGVPGLVFQTCEIGSPSELVYEIGESQPLGCRAYWAYSACWAGWNVWLTSLDELL